MASHTGNTHSSSALVYKLICHITKKPSDAIKPVYRSVLQVLNCPLTKYDSDEFAICERIHKKFIQEGKKNDAFTFVELFRKLQTNPVLKNLASVLHFFYSLYVFDTNSKDLEQFGDSFTKLVSLDSDVALNSHDIINKQINKLLSGTVDLSNVPDVQFSKCINESNSSKDSMETFPSKDSKVAGMFTTHPDRELCSTSNGKSEQLLENALSARSDKSHLGSVCYAQPNLRNILRDILYAIQGLRGNIIHWEPENNFNVVFKEEFPKPVKKLTLRLVELGWMYCRIKQYCIAQSNEKTLGLIEQSFVAALESKLFDYYKLIAELETLLTQESTLEHLYGSSNSLTLHRMSVRMLEPHTQLKILALVVDACKGKKGGALASVLYSHLHHGDHFVKSLIQNLLRDVTRPLLKMLINWICCGELEDAFGEFFVATNITVPYINLWQEKYSLNEAMIPSFITMEQARKILSTGKAINFLHQVCQVNTFARGEARRIKAFKLVSTESLFSQEKDANFENILENNYVKISKTFLQVLHDKYNLMDHLLAMRNYFLLGQGDFIRQLMDLLDTDLTEPGKSLYIQNLSGLLESAIRATNAQFHNPEVLQRLDVRLLKASSRDTVWDVFSLDYHVDGPIGTILTPKCMNSYFRLFTTLWRAKRMEYILNKISHSRTTYLKLQAKVPAVTPVLYMCHIILAKMVHFVQQMQYYMAFEVMECCWPDLLLKISSAQDLDQVIASHENFLDTLLTRAFLDAESLLIRTQLKAIYDLIIQFDEIQNSFWNKVKLAKDKLNEMNAIIEANTNKEEWGISDEQEREFKEPWVRLKNYGIADTKATLKVLSRSYEGIVQKFLIMLNDQDDPNLRFLSFRLDFNEYFKSRNFGLQTSQTYQHRRKFIK